MSAHARRLLYVLGHGRAQARTREDLCADLGLGDRRLRLLVEELRRAGVLVCSSNEEPGYFLAEHIDELEETAAHLRSRAISALVTARAMRRSATERWGIHEALRLFDVEGL